MFARIPSPTTTTTLPTYPGCWGARSCKGREGGEGAGRTGANKTTDNRHSTLKHPHPPTTHVQPSPSPGELSVTQGSPPAFSPRRLMRM